MEIHLSEIDRIRFGIITAKAKIDSGDTVGELLLSARKMGATLVIVRVSTKYTTLAQDLEANSALLTDTLVYYKKININNYKISLPCGYSYRNADPADAEKVERLATAAFDDYGGHYHADRRLARTDCNLVYSSWAQQSCLKKIVADNVVLINSADEIAAFATLKRMNNSAFDGVLYCVSPAHRSKGLHLTLMKLSQNWGVSNGFTEMITSTQVTNTTAQKNWCRVGMEPFESFYTFHIWIDHDPI